MWAEYAARHDFFDSSSGAQHLTGQLLAREKIDMNQAIERHIVLSGVGEQDRHLGFASTVNL